MEEVIRTAAKFLEDIQTSQAWRKEVETQEGLPCIQEYALLETCPFEETLSSKCQDTFGTAIWAQYDMVYGFCGWYPGVQKEIPSTEHNGWQWLGGGVPEGFDVFPGKKGNKDIGKGNLAEWQAGKHQMW